MMCFWALNYIFDFQEEWPLDISGHVRETVWLGILFVHGQEHNFFGTAMAM